MSEPSLSILLPTYNGERFLREQVNSILAQQFSDWELVICDDGSNDSTRALTADLASFDRRIRIIPTTGNRGQRRRLQELLGAARADLISIADQDDVWAPDKLKALLGSLGTAALAFGSSWLIDAAGRPLGRTLLDGLPPPPTSEHRLVYLFRPAVSAHAMIARRSLLTPASFARAQPFDWLQSLDAAFSAGAIYVSDAKTMHRMHETNQHNGHNKDIKSGKLSFRPRLIREHLSSLAAQRFTFVSNAEHLARSEIIPLETSQAFSAVYQRCRHEWYTKNSRPRWSNDRLRRDLLRILSPLAGSRDDLSYFEGQIESVTQNATHPKRLYKLITGSLQVI